MPQYAFFDNTVAAPYPVIGYFNTDAINYQNLPPALQLLELNAAQWAQTRLNPSGWYVSNGEFIKYTPPVILNLAQQAQKIISAAQITVSSVSYPSINGTYNIQQSTIIFINSELVSILTDGTFTNGETIVGWPDITGIEHNMTITEFTLFGKGVAKWYNSLLLITQTNTGTIPSTPYPLG